MGESTFSVLAAMDRINSKVEVGVNATLQEIMDMAVELAPVRKKGRRKKRTTAMGGVREKHEFRVGRTRNIAVTGGQFWEAFSRLPASMRTYTDKSGKTQTITRAQFRKMRVTHDARRVLAPGTTWQQGQERGISGYDARQSAASSGKTRGVMRGSEKTDPKGHLRDRIFMDECEPVGGKWIGRVVSPAPYSRYVEFPTHRTAAQPYLLPALKSARGRLKANIKAAKGG